MQIFIKINHPSATCAQRYSQYVGSVKNTFISGRSSSVVIVIEVLTCEI